MCLGNWSKLGHVRDQDVLAVTMLPDVEGDEEDIQDGWDAIWPLTIWYSVLIITRIPLALHQWHIDMWYHHI
jgi:hypothetical protein